MDEPRIAVGGKTYNSFTGKLRVLAKEDEFLYRVEVWLLNSEVNRNNWQYLNLDEHRKLFVDTPILVAYTGGKVGDGHNFRMKRDDNGDAYASFTDANAERIVGWFKNDEDIRIEEKDGVRWIVGNGTIWSYYARELADLLTEQGAEGMDVSIETLVDNIRVENGVEVFEDYQILGTTILGKGVSPAVAGAHIRALSLEDDLKDFKLRVASYMETAKETTKGTKRMAFNKVQLEELGKKFNGYKIVGASEDGKHIALMSETDNCFYGYTFEGEEEVNAENIKPVSLNAEAAFGEDEKVALCKCVTDAGADFIKTSTGFIKGGATFHDVELMVKNVAPHLKVKAAGGIKTLEDAEQFLKLGAQRLGTSRIVKIAKGLEYDGTY